MKMKNEITVGIFFFIALSILGYFTIIMGEEIFTPYEYYSMNVVFPDIEGLGENDKVKVFGVNAGIVENIQLKENNVWVTLKMYRKFTLYDNYKIRIRNETALGGKYVGIEPGKEFIDKKRYVIIHNYENLKGSSTGDITALLSELIAENKENLFKTINNIKEITGKLNSGEGTIGKLINEQKVHEDTDGLIQEIRETMEDAREQAPVTSFIRAALSAF
ncbi:MAG: MlaD family protein [Spirochaetota bacterium]|nr:MlaD family protein [Spirochaetota bacterium]